MEFFFIVIFFIILSNIFGASKKNKSKGKAQPWGKVMDNHIADLERRENNQNSGSNASRNGGQDWKEMTSRIKNISANQARQFSKQKAKQRERDQEAQLNSAQRPAGDSKDADDRNRHRSTDWGSRAGPGFLSTKTLIVLAGVFVIALILSQTPANIFR